MINILITIGIGGALGAITRYLSGVWLSLVIPNKPYVSTLFVNVIGSLLIGLFYLISEHMIIKDNIRLLFVVGFLGSLTTFSTFSYEFMTMINEKNYLLAISYILLNILLSGILIYIFCIFPSKPFNLHTLQSLFYFYSPESFLSFLLSHIPTHPQDHFDSIPQTLTDSVSR